MYVDDYLLFLSGLVLFLGSLFQGFLGFAFGLFSLPLLLFIGHSIEVAVAIVSFSLFAQALVGLIKLRASAPWRDILSASIIRGLFTPVGVVVLGYLASVSSSTIRQCVGLLIVGVLVFRCFAIRFSTIEMRDMSAKAKGALKLLAFSASGFFYGLASIGGPPLVIWLTTKDWSVKVSRAFLFGVYVFAIPVHLVSLYYAFPEATVHALILTIIFSPLVMLGSYLGVVFGSMLSGKLFRYIAIFVLSSIGLGMGSGVL